MRGVTKSTNGIKNFPFQQQNEKTVRKFRADSQPPEPVRMAEVPPPQPPPRVETMKTQGFELVRILRVKFLVTQYSVLISL